MVCKWSIIQACAITEFNINHAKLTLYLHQAHHKVQDIS